MTEARSGADPPSHEALRRFLDRTGAGAYHELRGFLFAVVSAPEAIPLSEWYPEALGERAVPQDLDEARRVIEELVEIHNGLASALDAPDPTRLVLGGAIRTPAVDNFEAGAPLSGFARGFMRGHGWLRELWDDLPTDVEDELGACLLVLTFFADRDRTAEFAGIATPDAPLEELGDGMLEMLPEALSTYQEVGRVIAEASRLVEKMSRSDRPGRNGPCPCGSGRKYKRCCGAA